MIALPVHSSEISDILREVADLLDIEGADDFKVRSCRQDTQSMIISLKTSGIWLKRVWTSQNFHAPQKKSRRL